MTRLQSNLQLGSLIDAGQFGKVFHAKDDVHGNVAVKVIQQRPGESAADWKTRKDGLLMEGQRLKQATHVNVVQVFQVLESANNDAVHLVMEYCKGGSLQTKFEKGPLPLWSVRKAATEVALGLSALHARNMLHRDIKPGNILLNGRAKLGDFGLVTDNIILGYGSQAGYADHISPEIWQGSGTSVRSDVWAFGMTIYRLIHGNEWYSRSPPPNTLVANLGFAKKLKWLPHVPETWRRFIRKMLQDDPNKRYQSANQIMNALATLSIEPRWSCNVTPSEVIWKTQAGKRRVNVVWKKFSLQKYEWSAWTEPIGPGRHYFLVRPTQRTGLAASETGLKRFFVNRS